MKQDTTACSQYYIALVNFRDHQHGRFEHFKHIDWITSSETDGRLLTVS